MVITKGMCEHTEGQGSSLVDSGSLLEPLFKSTDEPGQGGINQAPIEGKTR